MVTTAMIRSLSIRCFGFAKIVRCFIPHPSNEGPGQHPNFVGTASTTDCLFLNPGSDYFAARSQSIRNPIGFEHRLLWASLVLRRR